MRASVAQLRNSTHRSLRFEIGGHLLNETTDAGSDEELGGVFVNSTAAAVELRRQVFDLSF
jgi:hypothetical protein